MNNTNNTKRYLTEIEIDNILDFIVPNKKIPEEVSLCVVNKNKSLLKEQLNKIQIYPSLIPELKEKIKYNYFSSLVQPGESVGVICAQSIGEKQTQASILYSEKIFIKKNDKIIYTEIGKFIDNEIFNQSPLNKYLINNCRQFKLKDASEYSYIKQVSNIKILSVTQHEKLEWKQISEISCHPPNGNLIKITTGSGRTVITTLSHSHLCKNKIYSQNNNYDHIIPILGSELNIGDEIPVCKNIPLPEFNNKLKKICISDYIKNYDVILNGIIHKNLFTMKNDILLDNIFGNYLGSYIGNQQKTIINNKFNQFNNYNYKFLFTTTYKSSLTNFLLEEFMIKICNKLENVIIPNFVFECDKNFIRHVIIGFISSINYNINSFNYEIYINYEYKQIIEQIAILFSYFGIFGHFEEKIDNAIISYLIDL